jgi:hypothetical protein
VHSFLASKPLKHKRRGLSVRFGVHLLVVRLFSGKRGVERILSSHGRGA